MMHIDKGWKWFFIVPAAIVGMALFVFIGGTIVQWLWNWLLPPLFGWHTLTFWQALGALVLCRILFGGSGFMRGGNSNMGRRMGKRMADRISDRIIERWDQMTPEERDRLWQRLQERRGGGVTA